MRGKSNTFLKGLFSKIVVAGTYRGTTVHAGIYTYIYKCIHNLH